MNINRANLPDNIRSIFTQAQQARADIITVVPKLISIAIFDHGQGLFPTPGTFVKYKIYSYYQQSMEFIKCETLEQAFERNKINPALQICMGLMKEGTRARIWVSKDISGDLIQNHNQAQLFMISSDSNNFNKDLIFDIHILSFTSIPTLLQTQQEILKFFQQIIFLSRQGDQYLKKLKIQKSLSLYERSITKILSTKFSNLKQMILNQYDNDLVPSSSNYGEEYIVGNNDYYFNKNDNYLYSLKNVDKDNSNKNQKKLSISKQYCHRLINKCDNICIKFIELCLKVGEYLKILKVGLTLLKDQRLQQNERILLVLVWAYLSLGEYSYGNNYFQRWKKVLEKNGIKQDDKKRIVEIESSLQKILKQRKKSIGME